MKFNLYNVVVYIDFVCTWIIIIHNSWRIINNRYKDHLCIHMFGIHVVFVTFYGEPLYRALILYWDFSGLWLDKTSIQTMYMYDKKFYYMYVIKKNCICGIVRSLCPMSPLKRRYPKLLHPRVPHPPLSPPTPSRRVPPTLQQEKQFLSAQICPL